MAKNQPSASSKGQELTGSHDSTVRSTTAGLTVRGSCIRGHLLITDAPKGRLTWRGPCPAEGCGEYVIARRIKSDEVAPNPKTRRAHRATQPAHTVEPATEQDRYVVKKATRDPQQRPAARKRPSVSEPNAVEIIAEPIKPKPEDSPAAPAELERDGSKPGRRRWRRVQPSAVYDGLY